MRKISPIIEGSMIPEAKIVSIAVIEGDNNIAYSTDNWDLTSIINQLNLLWYDTKENRIIIEGVEYIKIQNTQEGLILVDPDQKGRIVCYKDEERKVILKISPEGVLYLGIAEAAKILHRLSPKKPYMDLKTRLGKVDQLKWATPRILLDDTNLLQELGLLKFGLSIEEAKVYLSLLEKGKEGAKVGQLNEELDIKRTTIYRIIDRLISKEWIVKPFEPGSVQIFIARPINDIFDERIQQREEELKILKIYRFIMGESYVPLEHDKSIEQKALDFKALGITGIEKDRGLLIFEYSSKVDNDIVIRAALQLSCEKLKMGLQVDEDIEEFSNSDLEDVDFRDTKFQDYLGSVMYLKFKEGSKTANNVGTNWIVAANQIAVPLETRIFVIWGTDEIFSQLLSIILKFS